MAKQILNGPSQPNNPFNTGDGTEHGDAPSQIVAKANSNFTELYNRLNGSAQYVKNTSSGATTAAKGDLTGAVQVTAEYSAVGAANLTTRTAAQMFSDAAAVVGQTYEVAIMNTSAGQMTLVGGTGVTITGTATIAAGAVRWFLVTFVSATSVKFQNLGSGSV